MENVIMAARTVEGMVAQIMGMLKTLPNRPEVEEVAAAKTLIKNIEREDQLRLDAINKQTKGNGVPEELFFVYLEMQKTLVYYQSKQQKREVVKLLDLENAHQVFDELIQRASQCVSGSNGVIETGSREFSGGDGYLERCVKSEIFTRDDSYVMKSKVGLHIDGFGRTPVAVVAPQIHDSTLKTSPFIGNIGLKATLVI